MAFEEYHRVWLSVHPERTEGWLKERLADGFHVHHLDGNHANNDPLNLVLIEGGDHLMLHNGKSRLAFVPPKKGPRGPHKKRKVARGSVKRAPRRPPEQMDALAVQRRISRESLEWAARQAAREKKFAGAVDNLFHVVHDT